MYISPPDFSHKGFMPLSRAATAGKDEIVTYLLSIKGVSPDRSTGEKVTGMHVIKKSA